LKIGEGAFRRKSQILYMPKAVVIALKLEDGDKVEYHIDNVALEIRKAKR